jgi:hypothetical protein
MLFLINKLKKMDISLAMNYQMNHELDRAYIINLKGDALLHAEHF